MFGSHRPIAPKLRLAFACLLGLLVSLPAFADEAPMTVSRDLSRYKEASLDGEMLLLAAYCVLWLLVAAFAFRLAGKQARVQAQLDALSRQLDAEAERQP